MPEHGQQRAVLIKGAAIGGMEEQKFVHPLNTRAIRWTRSLGDACGLTSLGVHLVRVKPGDASTEFHFHHHDEEWIYILSGHATAQIGNEEHPVGPGDFMGFVAGSQPHAMSNNGTEDLVYLVGGNRLPFDVCDYPNIRKRRYRTNGRSYFVTWEQIGESE